MRYIAAHSCSQYPMLAKCFVTIQTHKQAFTKGSTREGAWQSQRPLGLRLRLRLAGC